MFYFSLKAWLEWLEYSAIGAVGLNAFIFLLYHRKRIWHCIKGQNNNYDENRPLLDEGQDEIVGYAANLPNDLNAVAPNKDINIRGSKRNNTEAVFQ